MPISPTYPGVYIQEESSGVHTITGVSTSIAAFVGRALRGPVNEPVTIFSPSDFDRTFGGLAPGLPLGFAVRDFFLNGGTQAVIVRLFREATALAGRAVVTIGPPPPPPPAPAPGAAPAPPAPRPLNMTARDPGKWGANLRAILDFDTPTGADFAELGLDPSIAATDLFNLTIRDDSPGGPSEQFRNLTLNSARSPRNVADVLTHDSKLVTPGAAEITGNVAAWRGLADTLKTKRDDLEALEDNGSTASIAAIPAKIDEVIAAQAALDAVTVDPITALANKLVLVNRKLEAVRAAGTDDAAAKAAKAAAATALTAAQTAAGAAISDGDGLKFADLVPPGGQARKVGLFALEKVDLFNLLCIPPYTATGDVDPGTLAAAAKYCEDRRAFLLVDAPSTWDSAATAAAQFLAADSPFVNLSTNAAIFFPRLREPDPFGAVGALTTVAPCGAVAGVFARTDATRGVWKAPAGTDAALVGVSDLSVKLDDNRNGLLNPLGINCLRSFPAAGRVVWGARTLSVSDDYRYIPVRRTALFLEESLYRGTQFAVFEPNDAPLWAQLRQAAGSFMQDLFRQGAFQGSSPRQAYLVKCDDETTTQDDIDKGIVNLIVAFAPLKPAEFVVVYVQQLAGQTAV